MKSTKDIDKKNKTNMIKFLFLTLLIALPAVFFLKKPVEEAKENNVAEKVETKKVEPVETKENNKEFEKIKRIVETDKTGITELINKDNRTKYNDIKSDLIVPNVNLVAPIKEEKNLLRKEAAKALEDMLTSAKNEANLNIFLNSGYRSEERQMEVYNSEIHRAGEGGKNYVATPGYSEHQTGFAVDLTCKSIKFRVEECFEDSEEGKWVINNAHRYGYILRYPRGKEKLTGYNYEPWHYRYVGKDISNYLKKNNLTLEELYERIRK